MLKKRKRAVRNQSGYLLVEVMVSMVIILLGVVGIAKLQHVAKIANMQAVQRTIASTLADDLIERMRSNTSGIAVFVPTDSTVQLHGSSSTPLQNCTPDAMCDSSQLAAYDIWEWQQSLIGEAEQIGGVESGGLVEPMVCLKRPPGGGSGLYDIAIVWRGLSSIQHQSIADNATASSCGTAPADNAYDKVGNDNVYRRVHWQQIFLDA